MLGCIVESCHTWACILVWGTSGLLASAAVCTHLSVRTSYKESLPCHEKEPKSVVWSSQLLFLPVSRRFIIMVLRKLSSLLLEALCSKEQIELLDSIDHLRLQGINHYISLPQIIVCGDQSSGKSSVLEAISGVSFPIWSSLCTRFLTELVLRKSSQVGVCVSIVPHRSCSESEREALAQFHEELDSFEGLP